MLFIKTVLFLCAVGTTSSYVARNLFNVYEDICTCPCLPSNLSFSSEAATTIQEAQQKAAEIEKELTLDKSSTSAATRTKTSQPDTRISAKSIGAVGIIFILIVFGTIVILDVSSVRKNDQQKGRKPRKRRMKSATNDAPTINVNVEPYSLADFLRSISKSALHFPLNHSTGGASLRDSFHNKHLSAPGRFDEVAPRCSRFPPPDQELGDCLGWKETNPFNVFRASFGVSALKPPYRRTSEV